MDKTQKTGQESLPPSKDRLPPETSVKEVGSQLPDDSVASPSPVDAKLVRIDRETFPDRPRTSNSPVPSTFENFVHLINSYGIRTRFNQAKKRVDVEIPDVVPSHQNRDEAVLAHLESLAARNDMSPGNIRRYLLALADRNPFDPFADWVKSAPWDRVQRVPSLLATISPVDDYPLAFAALLIRKWLLSILAATFWRKGFRARGVLTFQGGQGIGKTSWFARLVSDLALRDDVVKLGYSWDGGTKDARISAVRHRIVELGELEGSFRKDIASLKSFITETVDKIRPPYARVEAEYPSSTIFAASVNDPQFLIDSTGNSRFWTIPVKAIDYQHDIDMQQLFAELKVDLDAGEQWWLTAEEEAQLAEINNRHLVLTAIEERLAEELDLDRVGQEKLPWLSARQVLAAIGFEKPSNAQFKEANTALRKLLGPSRRSQGVNRWPIPWASDDRMTLRASRDPEAEIY